MHFLLGMSTKRIELLAPAGSMANLKAAVSKGADAVYLGMRRFSARDYATNFNEQYLKEAIKICKSNNVKAYLAMNTLVKNDEVRDFFSQLSLAYSAGIDAAIIQEIPFLELIKKNYPGLRVHISTQAGVMNSAHAGLLSRADRITLARELTKEEIGNIRNNFSKELEIFCHGALCVSVSGSCLFSSLAGGRSGNRGKCAQPCRKAYNNSYYLSTKELCLIEHIPDIISLGINAVKIEGRMRTPHYTAAVTEVYRKAIDSFYGGNFNVSKEMLANLEGAFNREFTTGWFNSSKDMFNRNKAAGETSSFEKEFYKVRIKSDILIGRGKINASLPEIKNKQNSQKMLLARAYNREDAFAAAEEGADIVYFDLFDDDFNEIKEGISSKLFGITPRIMPDSDIETIFGLIRQKNPDGLLIGNLGLLKYSLNIPLHIDYNCNCFNDIDVSYFSDYKNNDITPIISPELSLRELRNFRNKRFITLVHGKIRLMTLRHELGEGTIKDEKGRAFITGKIRNGTEITNEKELGLLSKASTLVSAGMNNLFIDTDRNVREIIKFYRRILNNEKVNDGRIKNKYILGWSYRGVV